MSSYPQLPTLPRPGTQRLLPGIAATNPLPTAAVAPLTNGTAQLLFDGVAVGTYSDTKAANEGLQTFRRMGLCE